MHPVLVLLLVGILAIGVAPACSSSDVATSTTCSNGTPYTSDTVFPEVTQVANAHACIERCGDTSSAL